MQKLTIDGRPMVFERLFIDAGIGIPRMGMIDGQVVYLDGRPVTDPDHLAFVPKEHRPKPKEIPVNEAAVPKKAGRPKKPMVPVEA